MKTLHQYLQEKYPTAEDKAAVIKIATSEITEPLEGGELDLSEFKNLEEVIITNLTTPLTKIQVDGLIHLKELILPEKLKEETAEDKKLYEELGISDNLAQKKLIQEINKLTEIFSRANDETIKVQFATETKPSEKLGNQNGTLEKTDNSFDIYLQLERKDKAGNFCPNLVFWTFTQELTKVNYSETDPTFWQYFYQELQLVKQNLTENYQKEFELLLNPATFPQQILDLELLTVYYPNSENIPDQQISKTPVSKEVINQAWLTIQQEIFQLVSQELKTNPSEEKLKELAVKITIEDQQPEYIIQVFYHPQNPFQKQIGELIISTPLKLEIEHLKKDREQLPTPENYEKLSKEKQALENSLKGLTNEENYQKIKEKSSK